MRLASSCWPDELAEQELLCVPNFDPLDYPIFTDRYSETFQSLGIVGT